MFSDHYPAAVRDVKAALAAASQPTAAELREILSRADAAPLSIADAAALLALHGRADAAERIEQLREHVRSRFGSRCTVREVAPIYLSSFCEDVCRYCNFANGRHGTIRTRLDADEITREVATVTSEGSRVVEFTLATDPEMTPERLAQAVAIAAAHTAGAAGAGVMLCSDHLDESTYRMLASHGLWGMVQWDETLDRTAYDRWHRGSPRKANFIERIDNHDRAIRAGLHVATGVLLGLADAAFDVLMLIAKMRYLHAEYGVRPFTIGTPRMKPTGERGVMVPHGADDAMYELALLVYKLAEPSVGRWLQTREPFAMNLRYALDGDCFTYRCGEVKPGGHDVNRVTLPQETGGQFRVNELTKGAFERGLESAGISVRYAWTGDFARS